MNFLISGATGFIGSKLCRQLVEAGHNLICLSRKTLANETNIRFIDKLETLHSAEQIDVIINLAGAPISKRWSAQYKDQLINSRVNTTLDIMRLIARLEQRPKVLITASAIGYYGCQQDQLIDEQSDANQEFTHTLCHKWEQAALKAQEFNVRTCIIRLGVVLGAKGGALSQMLPAFKLGLGGKIGSGQQYFSWVHIDDVLNAIDFLIQNEHLHGAFNLTSPNPVTNEQFSHALAKAVNRPCFFTTPGWVIKLLFGEMGGTLLLNGQKVIPARLQAAQYHFIHPNLDDALKDVV